MWPMSMRIRALPRPLPTADSRMFLCKLPIARRASRPLTREAATRRITTRRPMTQATDSRWFTPQTRRHRPCPNTTSPRPPETIICGPQATGHGAQTATTGFPVHGLKLPTRARYGPPATGATGITTTASTAAIGAATSASMAVSITALATLAMDTRAASGAAVTFTTTAR